jgi:adenylate kinase family enzyme
MAEVVSAACGLGEPTMRVIGNATVAAAAQLTAAGVRTAGPDATMPPALSTSGTSAAPGEPLPEPEASRQLTRAAFEIAAGLSARPEPNAATTSPGGVTDHARAASPVPAPAPATPEPRPKTVRELLAELDGLIGLERVKREIHRQVEILRVAKLRKEAGIEKSATITRHLVFTGNPGTGKTTVARLVSGIYAAMELLTRGQLVEVDRSELVADYEGQTAGKTAKQVEAATGGVLFIDEAYSLTGDQYGTESVNTLVKEMEDRRDDLVVIVAGYPAPMQAFIEANPGLASRFRTTIEFENYSDDELVEILTLLAEGSDYEITPEALRHFRELLAGTPRGDTFGNGRFARNTLEAAIGAHAWRLRDIASPTRDQLRQLLPQDLDPDTGAETEEDPGMDPARDPAEHPDDTPGEHPPEDLSKDEQGDSV